MAYLLHIETATKVCSVALSLDGQLVALKESDDSEYIHGEVITLYIQDVMQQAKISINELAAVSVTSGPGSYTGLRIGVSTAKGLCYALNIPLIAVDALLSIASIARQKYTSTTICAMIDARRMEVFSTIFDASGELVKPTSADVLDETSYSKFEPFIAVGDGSSKMMDVWKNRNIQFDLTTKHSSIGQIAPAYTKFLKNDFEDVAYFEPFYLKDFVSTQKK